MNEVLLTSSVLILALLVLRQMFRRRISRRAQYALWGLVLARLLVPVSLPAVDFSVLTVAQPVVGALEGQSVYFRPTYEEAWAEDEGVDRLDITPSPYRFAALAPASRDNVQEFTDQRNVTHRIEYDRQIRLEDLLRPIWAAGALAAALWVLVTNARFWLRLRRRRIPLALAGCPCRVYLVEEGLGSPCLFGLIRPAVYLTSGAMATDESLRHVLAHETTHARHLDPLWSALRCLCLVLYWFNPLVWLAAAASRTDCELACDEGAIRRLGEAERIPYGQTLLHLIPVRRRPGSPLLTATTMTADKRRLRERITRIAEHRQTRLAALLAALALAGLACACTFTGGRSGDGDRPLTAEELAVFNQEFFNGDHINLRNQFLSSLYEAPGQIDLFELLYLGVPEGYEDPEAARADWDTVLRWVYNGQEPDCPTYEMTGAQLEAVLRDYMNLTLADTDRVGLENFTYLPEFDTYYWAHGDTNYRAQVTIAAGERQGENIRLYYEDDFMGGGWKRLTLRSNGQGGYWFVSNTVCQRPEHLLEDAGQLAPPADPRPAVQPNRELVLTIPLGDLEPYVPEKAHQMEPDEASADTMGEVLCDETLPGGANIVCYQTQEDPDIKYWAIRNGDRLTRFCREESAYRSGYGVQSFTNLFGHDGFLLAAPRGAAYNALDYYCFDGDGVPRLLVGCANESIAVDWSGDGTDEVLWFYHSGPFLYFLQGETVYLADLDALVKEAWPESSYLSWGQLSEYGYIPLVGNVTTQEGGVHAAAFRELAFDGENLLLYRRDRTAVDHLSPGVEGPEWVISALKEEIGGQFEMLKMISESLENPLPDGTMQTIPEYDDWRIESLAGPFYESVGSALIQIYRFNYELHTTTPERVEVAGGMYLDEDGWQSPGYPDCEYVYFLHTPEGEYQYLFCDMQNDCGPGDQPFLESLVNQLRQLGVDGAGYAPGLEEDARLPQPVREAAIEAATDARQVWQQGEAKRVIWDDQRLTALELVPSYHYGQLPEGMELEVYNVAYELHAVNPEEVILAGGTYLWDSGWAGGWHDETHMLVFQVLEDGTYVQLRSQIPSDVFPEAPLFSGAVAWTLIQGGVMDPSGASAEALYYRLYAQPFTFLDGLAAYSQTEQRETLEKLLTYEDAQDDIARGEGLLWDAIYNVQRSSGGPSEPRQAALEMLLELIEG